MARTEHKAHKWPQMARNNASLAAVRCRTTPLRHFGGAKQQTNGANGPHGHGSHERGVEDQVTYVRGTGTPARRIAAAPSPA